MSLRAIRKRESKPYRKQPNRTRKFVEATILTLHNKRSKSFPDLRKTEHTEEDRFWATLDNNKKISKSDSNVEKLAKQFENANLISAKSEVCLKTISVHKTIHSAMSSTGSAQSERNLKTSANVNNNYHHNNRSDMLNNNSRRMSEQSLSVYSHSSNQTTPSSEYERRGFADTSSVRIPIIGYEVMEERARFTVYKLRVENPFTNDCWLVLRRYTDFVRLNNKLKQTFPTLNLQLPRKKLFGDNFNSVFLDNRVQGLQMYVNSVMANNELRCSKIVREFFCLDEPPAYSESMEECRAIFEAQEETIAHLKMQLKSKDDLILSLQRKLRIELTDKEQLQSALKETTSNCLKCAKSLESLVPSTFYGK